MSSFSGIREPDKRVMVVTGHYGSGKTEFSVSLALLLAERGFGPIFPARQWRTCPKPI